VRGQRHAPAAFYPRERPGTHCTGGWVDPRAGLERCGNLAPTGIRFPDRLSRSQSLYRLRYPVHNAIPVQAWECPRGSRRLRLPGFLDSCHMKVVKLSALRTGRLYPPRDIPGAHSCLRLSRPQGLTVAGRIKSMESLNYTIGNRTCDLPACASTKSDTAFIIYPNATFHTGTYIRQLCVAMEVKPKHSYLSRPPWLQTNLLPFRKFVKGKNAGYKSVDKYECTLSAKKAYRSREIKLHLL